MRVIADLHVHSHFSRAVSPQMTIPTMAVWATKKGIDLVATGDWTHPLWMGEIERDLEETGNGLLKQKGGGGPSFLLSTEISCIFTQNGKCRRVHTLVWVPTILAAKKISKEITKRGGNVLSDGRPILGFSLIQLSELILSIEPHALIVPAHIWTPWFSVFGSMSGFVSLQEAFGEYEKYIYAVETGLSSSPDMNWNIKELQTRSIVSFSDAHSPSKLGREATVFELSAIRYEAIKLALQSRAMSTKKKSTVSMTHQDQISSTIEFYPEEGKYHYTGHRNCNIRLTPEESVAKGMNCSVCGKPLTQGVMERVRQLSTGSNKTRKKNKKDVSYYFDEKGSRPPFVMSVPLVEIIAEAIGSPVTSPKVALQYDRLIETFHTEFRILFDENISAIASCTTPQIADGIAKVRKGDIIIDPGYDGVFGVVKIWKSEKDKALVDTSKEQLGIFLS